MTRSPRSLLQAEDSQPSQPFLKGFMFQFWNHLHGPTLDLLQYVHVSLLLLLLRTGPSTPEVSSVLIPLFYMLIPQAFFFQAALQLMASSQLTLSCFSPSAGLCISICWNFMRFLLALLLSLLRSFCWQQNPLVYQPLPFWDGLQTCWGSHHLGLLVLSSISSSIHPWGTPPLSLLQQGFVLLMTTFESSSSASFHPPHWLLI